MLDYYHPNDDATITQAIEDTITTSISTDLIDESLEILKPQRIRQVRTITKACEKNVSKF